MLRTALRIIVSLTVVGQWSSCTRCCLCSVLLLMRRVLEPTVRLRGRPGYPPRQPEHNHRKRLDLSTAWACNPRKQPTATVVSSAGLPAVAESHGVTRSPLVTSSPGCTLLGLGIRQKSGSSRDRGDLVTFFKNTLPPLPTPQRSKAPPTRLIMQPFSF